MKHKKKHMDAKWTHPYADFKDGKMFYYLRLIPDFMDVEAGGFSHGLSIGGMRFETKEEALEYGKELDKFFKQMVKDW